VAAPIGLGILWHKHLMSLNTSPPPDPRAIPGGKNMATYGPEFVFGAAVVAGLLGLALLRPPWTSGRVPRLVAGVLLVGLGVSSPWLANAAANGLNKAGQHTYATGPIPFSVLGSTCGEAWTSSEPDSNGAFTRWALVGHDGAGTCSTIVAYRGWQQIWSSAAHGQQAYATLAAYGSHVLVAVRQGGTGALVALDDRHGNVLWRWRCPTGGNISSWTFRGINNHTRYSQDHPSITVACQNQEGNDQTYHVVPHRKLS